MRQARFVLDALLYGIELAYLIGKKILQGRGKNCLKGVCRCGGSEYTRNSGTSRFYTKDSEYGLSGAGGCQ